MQVYFDIEQAGKPLGRVVIGLYGELPVLHAHVSAQTQQQGRTLPLQGMMCPRLLRTSERWPLGRRALASRAQASTGCEAQHAASALHAIHHARTEPAVMQHSPVHDPGEEAAVILLSAAAYAAADSSATGRRLHSWQRHGGQEHLRAHLPGRELQVQAHGAWHSEHGQRWPQHQREPVSTFCRPATGGCVYAYMHELKLLCGAGSSCAQCPHHGWTASMWCLERWWRATQ